MWQYKIDLFPVSVRPPRNYFVWQYKGSRRVWNPSSKTETDFQTFLVSFGGQAKFKQPGKKQVKVCEGKSNASALKSNGWEGNGGRKWPKNSREREVATKRECVVYWYSIQ
jgi:hypothetical protein